MRPAARKRRIVICDDSAAFVTALKKFLERDPALDVAGTFGSAESLLAELDRLDPDLITMDLEMPGIGGLEAIRQIMGGERPRPILVLSAYAEKGSERAAEALAAGALEAMPKKGLHLDRPDDVWATAARGRIRRLATVQLDRPAITGSAPRAAPPRKRQRLDRTFDVVALGASTGGPPAVTQLLVGLPADFQLPILVVQHMPPGFIAGLVAWLDRRVALPVRLASPGERAEPGVWFAPDGGHLLLEPSMRFAVDSETVRGSHRPAVDVLFESVASAAGKRALGIILTGMGRDGARGTEAICAAGGTVIAQDEASSAVFGMPAAAGEAGADLLLPLAEVGMALRDAGARRDSG